MRQPVASDSPFYSTHELQTRYGGVAKSTIYRKIRDEGFPKPERFGVENLYVKADVHDWEKRYMPRLHSGELEEREVRAPDEKEWQRFRVARAARIEAQQAARPKPRRKKRRRST